MTSQAPDQPAPFAPLKANKVQLPNPRTVRAQDLTWYNTRAGNIIKTSYNKCNGKVENHYSPWNRPPVPPNDVIWPCDVPLFDLYGVGNECPCELNRCRPSNCNQKRCPIYGGSYVNPN
jgi:hypothetical protein